MDDHKLLRYSRHILLEPFGLEAQARLDRASVLVVGAGGLGAAALMYLASAGVGRIIVADGDVVDLTNLQRQVIHREATIGINKAQSAKAAMEQINSTIAIEVIAERLDQAMLDARVDQVDMVLDCSDNFATRHAINRACVRYQKMLVSGAAIRFDGQVTCFDFRRDNAPCYACLFPDDSNAEEERCAVMGVFAPLVGVIGTMQATMAILMLADVNDAPAGGKLHMFDARSLSWRMVRYQRDTTCAVCAANTNASATPFKKEIEHA